MPSEALGLLECKGLVALMEGTDAMLKAANVEMIGWDKAGSGMVTAFVKGDVAAVKAAIDAGAEAAGRVGSVVAVHVIARPHDDLPGMYPKAKKPATAGAASMAGRMAEPVKK
ncbi:MAG TPA: BMC domain-containing protein [Tepidisphaeraceae bacterium]|nr:BMC domain-containing protein [Tepidisphaeraceae bacterium]